MEEVSIFACLERRRRLTSPSISSGSIWIVSSFPCFPRCFFFFLSLPLLFLARFLRGFFFLLGESNSSLASPAVDSPSFSSSRVRLAFPRPAQALLVSTSE